MAQVIHARLHAGLEAVRLRETEAPSRSVPNLSPGDVALSIHEDLSETEAAWRAFEAHADGTVFQSFDWLAYWQRHVGALEQTRPAIVVGRDVAGDILFLLPLALRPRGFFRELTWLGSDLCDYNGPLLAADFSARLTRDRFRAVWDDIAQRLQAHPRLYHHVVSLTKMPLQVGAQPNPMLALPVTAHPSGAYLTRLDGDWETFYTAKRSPSTRRRDRTKRKRLGDLGAVHLVEPSDPADKRATIDTLMVQKARAFAHMGVGNLFARPGYSDFYRALADDPANRSFVHVSRLDVGATPAAINLGLSFRGRYYHLLASYDDGEVSRFGPGSAHLHELMRLAIERGLSVFDFTIGDEPYKRDWSDTELTLFDHIAAANWRGVPVVWAQVGKQQIKRAIKQTPALWSLFSKTRAWFGGWRSRQSPSG
ncbi:MAG: GNAT family N-acetyltransferase [Pseudolabrys sp.]|nr:GNAT family N-acetyltransferase [Pseudolabrys sp.]